MFLLVAFLALTVKGFEQTTKDFELCWSNVPKEMFLLGYSARVCERKTEECARLRDLQTCKVL